MGTFNTIYAGPRLRALNQEPSSRRPRVLFITPYGMTISMASDPTTTARTAVSVPAGAASGVKILETTIQQKKIDNHLK